MKLTINNTTPSMIHHAPLSQQCELSWPDPFVMTANPDAGGGVDQGPTIESCHSSTGGSAKPAGDMCNRPHELER